MYIERGRATGELISLIHLNDKSNTLEYIRIIHCFMWNEMRLKIKLVCTTHGCVDVAEAANEYEYEADGRQQKL